MAVRYSQELVNIAGDEYRVDIFDDKFVGTASEFILVDFEVDWKGQQNDRSNFMTGSSCTVLTQSTTSSNLDILVSDILSAEEGRFTVAIYKKQGSGAGSYRLWWWGLILNDLSQGSDEAPATSYTITATDGLGILKGIPFENSGSPYTSMTAVATLLTALQVIPYSIYGSSDIFLHTRVNWFEANMATTSDDPLNMTQLPSSTFYKVDKDGNYDFNNCYEVIETICNLFKARLFYANGVWRFYQVYDLENENSFNQYRYYFDKTQHSGTQNLQLRQTLTGGYSGGTRLATQTFESFAPLREVSQVFIHDSSDNLIKGITFNQSTPLTALTTSALSSGNGETLAFSGTLQTLLEDITGAPYTAVVVYIKVRMTLRVGSYYLVRPINNQVQNNDYATLDWQFSTTGPPDYVEYITVQNTIQYGGISIPINFETPALPQAGIPNLRIEIDYVQDLQQNNISANYTTQAILQNPYLEYRDGDAENERIYKTLNSTTAFFSDVIEFPELRTGDRVNSTTANAIKVYDGAGFIDSTADWGRGTLSGNQNIIRLGIEEFIAGQRTAVRRRQGEFVGQFEMYNVLGVSSEYFLFLGVQYFANDARFSGEWYKVGQYNINDLTTTAIGLPISVQYPPDAPSAGLPAGAAVPLPTNVVMDNAKITIYDNSTTTRKIVLDADTFNYIVNSLMIGTDTQETSAVLAISSTTQGFLLPRMTAAQRGDIASPATGLMVYQTDATAGIYVYNGSSWDAL